jgi:hypothetical protein
MRVSEAGTRAQPGGDAAERSRKFGDAMRRAREGGASEARGAAAREGGARGAVARRSVADTQDAGLAGRRERSREDERAPAASPGAAPAAAPLALDAATPAELRAVLRALPVTIDASRVREGAPLSLSLGRALDVELRAGQGGVEVVLRPEPRLARVAEAELPGLVASLRARGIAVARAAVHARVGDGARGGRAAGRAR